jgi:BolA family transcriptional regulator, general stress-responsive regulator
MNPQNRVIDEMEARLRAAFTVTELQIEDESEQHRGHAGWREGGETHFHVRLAAPELGDLSRIERHRAVHAALKPDLVARIHALRLTLG